MYFGEFHNDSITAIPYADSRPDSNARIHETGRLSLQQVHNRFASPLSESLQNEANTLARTNHSAVQKQSEISSVVDTLVKPDALTSPRRVLSIHLNAEEISNVYHSFLVRLWQEHPNASWRASAQSVQNGKLIHFATLDALTEFLYAQTRGETNDKKIDHKKEIPS